METTYAAFSGIERAGRPTGTARPSDATAPVAKLRPKLTQLSLVASTAGSRVTRLRGRIARTVIASTMALGVIGTASVLPVAAAAYDVSPSPSVCVGNPGSNVHALAPYVVGTRTTYETIYWTPVLQRWTASGWANVAVSPNWITFRANNINGSYDYYNTKSVSFDRDQNGYALGAGYYRMLHVIVWGSTGVQRNVAEQGWCRMW